MAIAESTIQIEERHVRLRTAPFMAVSAVALILTGCSNQASPLGSTARPVVEDSPSVAGEPSPATESTPKAGVANESDQEQIWDVCYAPGGSARQVNSNDSVTDEVLSEYPDAWLEHAPIPEPGVSGVCHQHIAGSGGVHDVWWVHFADAQDGYDAATAWNAQLVAAGIPPVCLDNLELENGPSGQFSCSYALKGNYTGQIHHASDDGVTLLVQPPPS